MVSTVVLYVPGQEIEQLLPGVVAAGRVCPDQLRCDGRPAGGVAVL